MAKNVTTTTPEEMPELLTAPMDQESMKFLDKSMEIAHHIYELMKQMGLKQKDLAEKMGKSEAELSKWLNGRHNFTIRSLAKLELALGSSVITTPNEIHYHIPMTLRRITQFEPKEEPEYELSGKPLQTAKVITMKDRPISEKREAAIS
ncbi:MAG: helix-turn-helix transcriptional regulator [Sediminibacterium sp.]